MRFPTSGYHLIGLSKLPRIVDMFARRLQIQERPTLQVAQAVREVIKPLGVGLICEGAFRDRKETRDEFLALVNHRGNGH